MTEPVDTDALRDMGDNLESWGYGDAGVLRAAADEVDRLRKDVAFWIEQSETWKRLANDERDVTDRLRAAIENAPHGDRCRSNGWYDRGTSAFQVGPCTCWKAKALG